MLSTHTLQTCKSKEQSAFYYASIRSLSLRATFWYGFSISVALSLSMMRNITPGGSDTKVVGRNTRWKRTVYVSEKTKNKKNLNNYASMDK